MSHSSVVVIPNDLIWLGDAIVPQREAALASGDIDERRFALTDVSGFCGRGESPMRTVISQSVVLPTPAESLFAMYTDPAPLLFRSHWRRRLHHTGERSGNAGTRCDPFGPVIGAVGVPVDPPRPVLIEPAAAVVRDDADVSMRYSRPRRSAG